MYFDTVYRANLQAVVTADTGGRVDSVYKLIFRGIIVGGEQIAVNPVLPILLQTLHFQDAVRLWFNFTAEITKNAA